MDDEKYIASDFISDFRSHASGIENLNIILPSIVKRQFFNSRIEMKGRRGQDYWKSKSWLRLHRKLGGILYISGSLSRRSSNKKEHFVFKLAATIGYNDLNKELTPIMINELQQNFPQQTLIDREFEFELFEAFSSKFATFSEYLIGWSHLISGSLLVAYRMHKDILNNNKQSFFSKGYLKDLRIIIRMEALAILKDCKKYPKAYIADCSDLLLSLFPEDTNTLIGISRSLIMTSSESDFDNSVTRALQLTSKAKMNKENRATLHANKAYLLLLKAKYSQAEDEYEIFFRKPAREVAEQIVQYCNEQIADGTDRERPTAHYVKVLMLSKIKADTEELYDAYEEAFKHIPESHYYHQKLKSMAITLKDSKTTKKKRRARQKQQKWFFFRRCSVCIRKDGLSSPEQEQAPNERACFHELSQKVV